MNKTNILIMLIALGLIGAALAAHAQQAAARINWAIRLGKHQGLISYNKRYNLIAVCYDQDVAVLDPSGKIIWKAKLDGNANTLQWSPDGNYLAVGTSTTGCNFGVLHIFTRTGKLIYKEQLHGDVYVKWNPHQDILAAAGFEAHILNLYRIQDGKAVKLWSRKFDHQVFHVEWSPDGSKLAIGLAEKCLPEQSKYVAVALLDPHTGKTLWSTGNLGNGWPFYIAFDTAGKEIAVGITSSPSSGQLVILTAGGKVLARHKLGAVGYIAALGGDKYVVVASKGDRETTVYIYSNGTLRSIHQAKGRVYAGLGYQELISPDKSLLALPLANNTVQVVNTKGLTITELHEPKGPITAAWISSNTFLYSCKDGTLKSVTLLEQCAPVTVTTTSTTTVTVTVTKTSAVTNASLSLIAIIALAAIVASILKR